jgi:hypothetical protein
MRANGLVSHTKYTAMWVALSAGFTGQPDYSDNGSHFIAKELQSRFKSVSTKHRTAPRRSPWSVGLTERTVKQVLNCLRVISARSTEVYLNWDQYLPMVIQAINTRVMDAHGYSPAQITSNHDMPVIRTIPGLRQATSTRCTGEPTSILANLYA